MPKKFIIALLAAVLMIVQISAQDLPDSTVKKIDSICAAWNKPSTPGCAVGVVRNDSLVFSKGYGLANLEYDIPITDSTIFHMASVSKQFTAFSIVLLEQAGKLSLDDDIRKYLPWFPDLGTKITIRELLHHTSGIRDQWQLLAIQGTRMDDVITQQQIIKILGQQRALNFPPGTEWNYSNSNFTLAGEIVKAVSGQTLRRFTDSAIFQPLGMTHTHFHDDYTEIVNDRAYSYSRKDSAHYANSILSYSNVGATSLFTNVDDMARWLSNFYLHKVGDEANIDTLTTKGRLSNGKVLDYALGINNGERRGWKEFSHGGADAGYRTYVAVYPEARLGVIVFGNIQDFDPTGIARKITDLLLKDKTPAADPTTAKSTPNRKANSTTNPTAKAQPQPPKDTAAAVLTRADLAALRPYLGGFVAANGITLDLVVKNGKLYFLNGGGQNLLIKDSAARYVMFNERGIQFTFEPIHKNKDTTIYVKAEDQVEFQMTKYPPINDKDERILRAYVGSYYCPELGCTYGIAIKDHHLVLTNNKYDDAPLRLAGPNHLLCDNWWMNNLTIRRNIKHQITGFDIDAIRVEHLAFNKIASSPPLPPTQPSSCHKPDTRCAPAALARAR